MKSRPAYKLLQFIPDPFDMTSITIGALVETASGVTASLAEPGERLLPQTVSKGALSLFRSLVPELRCLNSLELPMSLGPHVVTCKKLFLPEGVDDAVTWVNQFVLPKDHGARHARKVTRMRRDTLGMNFFRQERMNKLVRRGFKPDAIGAPRIAAKPISQYVANGTSTLLLEPINVDTEKLDDELRDVSSTLLAWKSLSAEHLSHALRFSVYCVGTSLENFRYVSDNLRDVQLGEVFDTNASRDKTRLLSQVREYAGETA